MISRVLRDVEMIERTLSDDIIIAMVFVIYSNGDDFLQC